MKTIVTAFFCLLLLACNNAEDKNAAASATEDTPTTSSANKTEAASNDRTLKQNGTYNTLFEREPGDCNFISEEGIAKAIGVSSDLIVNTNNNCTFSLTEANGTTTRFKFSVEPWGNKTILKEIKTAQENAKTFGKDSRLSQYRLSESGDTYVSMHQNKTIRILNAKNNNVIKIHYSIKTSPTKSSVTELSQQKDTAREYSYAIANYLLNTNKH